MNIKDSKKLFIELHQVGGACARVPDAVVIDFDSAIVDTIARSLALVKAEGSPGAEMVISFPRATLVRRLDDGGDDPYEADSDEGDFEASSFWLAVDRDGLTFTAWERKADDTMTGRIGMQELGDLAMTLEERMKAMVPDLIERLAG